jgi:hypothetical protein
MPGAMIQTCQDSFTWECINKSSPPWNSLYVVVFQSLYQCLNNRHFEELFSPFILSSLPKAAYPQAYPQKMGTEHFHASFDRLTEIRAFREVRIP